MKYSISELGFILYNNRSVNGVIQNFLDPNMDAIKLIDIEKKFDWVKSLYSDVDKMVEVDLSLLDIIAEDITLYPKDIDELTEFFKSHSGIFSEDETNFLLNRRIPLSIIDEWGFLGLSNFKDYKDLEKIGATCHPILSKFLKDGIDEGGIVQPLYENGRLVNCSIRRITDVGKLKYTLAIPDIPVWGLGDIEGEEIWICEGLFDMIALREMGVKSVSPSSAMWSGIQLYKLIEKKPKNIIIFADNDQVGLKTGAVMHKFFSLIGIPSIIYHSKYCKDACEHFYEKSFGFDDIEEIKITKDMIKDKDDNSFDFLRYLQKRKF